MLGLSDDQHNARTRDRAAVDVYLGLTHRDVPLR